MRTRWSKAEEAIVAELWREGVKAEDISKRLRGKFSKEAVRSKLERMGVEPRAKNDPLDVKIERILNLHDDGYRPAEISRVVFLRTDYVRSILLGKGREPHTLTLSRDKVHPMWSMEETERRAEFIAKFNAGWAKVKESYFAGG